MKDILDREINIGDLVLAYPGSNYFSEAKYCIVIGSNRVYNGKDAFTTSKCIKIGALTEEQEKIKKELMSSVGAYNKERVVQNANKLIPVPGGVYMGDSSQYCYLYLGRYRVESNQKGRNKNMTWPVNYDTGGYCYIKFPMNNESAKKFLEKYLNNSISADDFNLFMGNYNNFCYVLNTASQNGPSYELTNFVISSRKRTFVKQLGKIKIVGIGKTMYFDIHSLKSCSQAWYVRNNCNGGAYFKFIPIQ